MRNERERGGEENRERGGGKGRGREKERELIGKEEAERHDDGRCSCLLQRIPDSLIIHA